MVFNCPFGVSPFAVLSQANDQEHVLEQMAVSDIQSLQESIDEMGA